ncbi:lasso RiPP family leader peptide-containing protein [Isoptericola aurantiacus]
MYEAPSITKVGSLSELTLGKDANAVDWDDTYKWWPFDHVSR